MYYMLDNDNPMCVLFSQLSRALLASYPVQKVVQINAITNHKLAVLNLWASSSLFEEDSDTGLSLKERALRLEARKDEWLKLSRTVSRLI